LITLGMRVLWKLQRPAPGRTAEPRALLLAEGGSDHHRKLEETLQHQAPPQRLGIPAACAWNHRPDGPKASHAL